MIANARMYSVSAESAALWRGLLHAVIEHASLDIAVLEHREPAPLEELWRRTDMAGVFMCGLPFSLSRPAPLLLAAPVPNPPEFCGLPQYWSEFVVRSDSALHTVADTFGSRIALTVPGSQSGCWAALYYLKDRAARFPVYREVIAPQVTPLGAVKAVVAGDAEVAPIDAYAFRLLQRYRSDLTSALRIVGRTESTPIPPLVASPPLPGGLQRALLEAHRNTAAAPLLAAVLLERLILPDPGTYDALRLNFEAAHRYWREHPFASAIHPAFGAALALDGNPLN